MNSFARALEVIPRQLCDNAGFDATDVLNRLRQKHAQSDGSGQHYGVDLDSGELVQLLKVQSLGSLLVSCVRQLVWSTVKGWPAG